MAVASIDDLEAQGAQHASGAVYASAEVVGTEWASGRIAVRDAENGRGWALSRLTLPLIAVS